MENFVSTSFFAIFHLHISLFSQVAEMSRYKGEASTDIVNFSTRIFSVFIVHFTNGVGELLFSGQKLKVE